MLVFKKHTTTLVNAYIGIVKKLCLIISLVSVSLISYSQVVVNNHSAKVFIGNSTHVTTTDLYNEANGDIENNGNLYLTGNWSNSATYTPGTGRVAFEGLDSKSISCTDEDTFYRLEVRKTSDKHISLNNNVLVNSTLLLESGTIETGTNRIHVSNADNAAIEHDNGWVVGNLERTVNNSNEYLYPVGESNYNPFKISFASNPTGSLLVKYNSAAIGNAGIISPGFDDNGVEVYETHPEGYWATKAFNGLNVNIDSIKLDYSGFSGVNSASRILRRDNNGDLALNGTHGNVNSPVISRKALDKILTDSTDFAIGRGRPRIPYQSKDTAICNGFATPFAVNSTGQGTLTYQWQVAPIAGSFSNITDNDFYSNTQNDTLEIKKATLDMSGFRYRCLIKDEVNNEKYSDIILLTVDSIPVISFLSSLISICNNDAAIIVPTTDVVNTTYSWKVTADPLLDGSSNDSIVPIANPINQILTNNDSKKLNITYSITPTGPSTTYCIGETKDVIIQVNPTPNISLVVDDPNNRVCDSTNLRFALTTLNGIVDGSKYYHVTTSADISVLNEAITGTYELDTFYNKLINTSNIEQNVKYTIKPLIKNLQYASGKICEGKDTVFDVKVLPDMKLDIIAKNYVGGWNVKCKGDKNDTIRVKVNGGATEASYGYKYTEDSCTFKWSNNKTSRIISQNGVGFYKVIVSDHREGCKDSTQITLYEPQKLVVDSVSIFGLPPCAEASNGMATCYVRGGTEPYTYDWARVSIWAKDFNISYRLKDTIIGVRPDKDYGVVVVDANSCLDSAKASHKVETNLEWPVIASNYYNSEESIYEICYGAKDAFIYPYDLPWDNSQYYWYKGESPIEDSLISNTKNISSLAPGKYLFLFKNTIIGCENSKEFTVLSAPKISITHSKSNFYDAYNISCHNSANGWIKIDARSYTNRLRYQWLDPDASSKISTSYRENLESGQYIITVIDSVNLQGNNDLNNTDALKNSYKLCMVPTTVTLTKPAEPQVTPEYSDYNGKNVACYGGNNAWIEVHPSGGFGTYTYDWLDSNKNVLLQDVNKIVNLSEGKYSVKVKYGQSCSKTFDFELNQPDSIAIKDSLSNYQGYSVSCAGSANGSAFLTVKGGIPEYTYNWTAVTPGNTVNTILQNQYSLKAGKYKVEVTDKNMCTKSKEISLTQSTPLESFKNTVPLTCFESHDGKASIDAYGGVAPYRYKWEHGPLTASVAELDARWYAVETHDLNNCVRKDTVLLTQPNFIKPSISIESDYNGQNITCQGKKDASLSVTAKGGTPPFTYQWSSKDQDTIVTGLGAGLYSVVVTDLHNCKGRDSIEVTQPEIITSNFDVKNASCFGFNDGTARAIPFGGTMPYKFLWNDGQITQTAVNLPKGTHEVLIQDINNCYSKQSVEVTHPKPLVETTISRDPYCPATHDGSIRVSVTGATPPYAIKWSNGDTGDSIFNLVNGIYHVAITDQNGCLVRDTIRLKNIKVSCFDVPNAFSPNNDGINDIWDIKAGLTADPQDVKEVPHYSNTIIQVFNRWGELVFQSDRGYKRIWDGRTRNGRDLPMDSYYYVIDPGDGSEKLTGVISIVR